MNFRRRIGGGYDCEEVDNYIDGMISNAIENIIKAEDGSADEIFWKTMRKFCNILEERRSLKPGRMGGYDTKEVDGYIRRFSDIYDTLADGAAIYSFSPEVPEEKSEQHEEVIFRKTTEERK